MLIPSLQPWGFDCRGESHQWGSFVVRTSQNDFALATRHKNEMNSIAWIDSKLFVAICLRPSTHIFVVVNLFVVNLLVANFVGGHSSKLGFFIKVVFICVARARGLANPASFSHWSQPWQIPNCWIGDLLDGATSVSQPRVRGNQLQGRWQTKRRCWRAARTTNYATCVACMMTTSCVHGVTQLATVGGTSVLIACIVSGCSSLSSLLVGGTQATLLALNS